MAKLMKEDYRTKVLIENKTVNVALREKPLSNNTVSLYLDFYPPIINADGKLTRREFLNLYLYENPQGTAQKEYNKDVITRLATLFNEKLDQLKHPVKYKKKGGR